VEYAWFALGVMVAVEFVRVCRAGARAADAQTAYWERVEDDEESDDWWKRGEPAGDRQ
jgi:hypothetical protein